MIELFHIAYLKGHPHLATLPAILLATVFLNHHTEQVSSNMFENCGKKNRHPHLAILRAMLNMFNSPAMLLAIFIYFEEEVDYNLAKRQIKC